MNLIFYSIWPQTTNWVHQENIYRENDRRRFFWFVSYLKWLFGHKSLLLLATGENAALRQAWASQQSEVSLPCSWRVRQVSRISAAFWSFSDTFPENALLQIRITGAITCASLGLYLLLKSGLKFLKTVLFGNCCLLRGFGHFPFSIFTPLRGHIFK